MKISKIISGIAAGVLAAVCITVSAFAETKDFEPSVSGAILTDGAWHQSVTYSPSEVDPSKFTPDTTIEVQYELEGEKSLPNQYPVELILQNFEVDPQIWAQVVPTEYDDTHAVFYYDAMTSAYGSDDLSTVNNIFIGDRGVKMKVTYVKITNYGSVEDEKETAAETEATEKTEAETEVTAETTTAETTAAADSAASESGNSVVVMVIIIAAVVVVALVIVIIVVSKNNKKRFY